MGTIEIYHGSDHVVDAPQLGLGRKDNDYGQGFYCTTDKEMACEWACKSNRNGFVNTYEFDTTELKTLDLLDDEHDVLHWITLLLANRTFTLNGEVAHAARDFLIENYLEDVADYDVVYGYRADDSYFAYAESFVENALSLRGLEQALRLGELGTQIVLVSHEAFSRIRFVEAGFVERSAYYPKFKKRDVQAREDCRSRIRAAGSMLDDMFVMDIMRRAQRDEGL